MDNRNHRQGDIFATNRRVDKALFEALSAVFSGDAYCQQALTDAIKPISDRRHAAFVTSAFYGILDGNVRLEFVINSLCDKKPDVAASIVLKIGLYYIGYAKMPTYAAVNRAVDLSKHIGGVYGGFINAVLKRSIDFMPKFKSALEKFSYDHCAPEWLCKTLINDYSEGKAVAILDAELNKKTHIRPIKGRISEERFFELAHGLETTKYGCYCDKSEMSRFPDGSITAQSLSSVIAVNTYIKGIDGGKALDLCAAPGGKAIYLTECGNFDVTACDIFPHKIELIKKYAQKTGSKLKVLLNDASIVNDAFADGFDLVVCDCPCSGTGTLKTKPDIMLRRKPEGIEELTRLQKRILDAASGYCKVGGALCYSTCSVLKCENTDVASAFLRDHGNYEEIDRTSLFPDTDGCDGFYIARFKRVK